MFCLSRNNSLIRFNVLRPDFLRQVAKLARLVICASILLLTVACQSPLQTAGVSADSTIPVSNSVSDPASDIEQPPATVAESQLSPELLYDLLVAFIAAQRYDAKLALESLSRAAYRSRDSRLITESIRFALATEAYQHAHELAQFFNRLEPDNPTATLFLAKTQFKLGDTQRALLLLTDLVKNKTNDDVSLLQDIATLLAQQNQKTILTEFTKRLEKTPTNANAQLTLTAALLASKLGNADEYIRLLDDTLEPKPDWEVPGMLKLIALSDSDSGQDIGKINDFATTHLNRYPQHNLFRLQYARLLIQQHETDRALTHLKEILQGKPAEIQHNADALFMAGIIYLDKNLLEESRKMLTRYLELGTNNQDRLRDDQSRIYLADIELKLKNYPAAASYLHGVSSPSHYLDAQIKMGWVIAGRDDVDSALVHLRQIYTANDNQKIRVILAQDALLKARNRLAQSKLVLNEGLKQYPQQPDLLYSRGLLAAQMNLLVLHERDMRKVIDLQPENAHAYNALGYTLADQTDRLDEALTLITKAYQLLPDDPFILDSMGWVHFRLGNNAQAIIFLRRAFHIGQDAEITAHLGEVLWVSDNKAEALKIWAQGIEWAPENLVLKNTIERFSQQQSSNNRSRYPSTIQIPLLFVHTTPVILNGICV